VTPAADQLFRILAVEDEPDLRHILAVSLRPMEVVTAVNGLDGLMKLDRVEPDFIISDVMMPEMDGWEFVRRVRLRPGYGNTPVMYLTALTSRDDMKKGYETGCDVYLTKPYDPARLRKNLDVIVDQFSLQPKAKRFTIEQLHDEEQRLAEAPRVPSRATIRPEVAESAEVPPPRPAPRPRPAAVTPKPAPPPAKLPPRLLVITADEKLVAELRSGAPQSRCEIMAAEESPAAMDKTSRCQPDALLLHWQLPEHHAPVLAELISESPECKGRPLLIVSDKRLGGAERRQLDNLGVFDVLRRPIKARAMGELLDDIDAVSSQETRQMRIPWEEVERLEASGEFEARVEPPITER
jgi:DNA-binding response OmpR family regulator